MASNLTFWKWSFMQNFPSLYMSRLSYFFLKLKPTISISVFVPSPNPALIPVGIDRNMEPKCFFNRLKMNSFWHNLYKWVVPVASLGESAGCESSRNASLSALHDFLISGEEIFAFDGFDVSPHPVPLLLRLPSLDVFSVREFFLNLGLKDLFGDRSGQCRDLYTNPSGVSGESFLPVGDNGFDYERKREFVL